ncbi:ATP-binding protein [Massilia sp. H6]|uniref:ATP-binding protein n=1 Tax=Massilia sp. H6 TaxID=2970464 RepID=UPI002169D683|nr:ATP-binding protein [Massilia sp. H6]UVW29747.1 histidine kinase [Massilia sp. H6]
MTLPIRLTMNLLSGLLTPPVTVSLPFSFNAKNLHVLLQGALDEESNPRASKIILDFAKLNFADPTAITVLSNVVEYLRHKHGTKVVFRNFHFPTEGNKFLDDSAFFLRYVGEPVFKGSKLRTTTLPLELVTYDRSWSWIHHTFAEWISQRVGLSPASFASIYVCLQEIFNNISDHSGEKIGCVFAQHYPQKGEVMLTISDFGVGIPFNVRKVEPGISDAAALAKAVIEGFTTKSTHRNRGAGLNILTRYVVENNRGRVFVQSLKGTFNCIHAASGVRMSPRTETVSYPGTLIQITFRTGSLEPIAEKEEFEW